jgi:hypothetical protein
MIALLTGQLPALQGWESHPGESKCTIFSQDDLTQSKFSLPKGGAPGALQSSGLHCPIVTPSPGRYCSLTPIRSLQLGRHKGGGAAGKEGTRTIW